MNLLDKDKIEKQPLFVAWFRQYEKTLKPIYKQQKISIPFKKWMKLQFKAQDVKVVF
jgi:hypothetical protein